MTVMRHVWASRYIRFVVASGISLPFNVLSRIVFSNFVSFGIAVILSHCVGMTVAFVLNRVFVFEGTGGAGSAQLMRFAAVNLISLGQTWLVATGLLHFVFRYFDFNIYPELCAHIVGLGTASVTSFLGHRYFSFGERFERRA